MFWQISKLFGISLVVSLFCYTPVLATSTEAISVLPDEFFRGVVLDIQEHALSDSEAVINHVKIRLENGELAGEEITVLVGGTFADAESGITKGDRVVVTRNFADGEATYYIADRYRLPWVLGLIALLIAAAVLVGKKKGFTATLGLGASVGIIGWIVIPQLVAGHNPLLVVFLAALAIGTITTFLTHGAKQESFLILGSIGIALVLGTICAIAATYLLNLAGIGSEEAITLTYGPLANIDLRGLLIAGVILGCLGVLDDVVATQIAAVKELADVNANLTRPQLYRRAMRIGTEHIAALINTLFLAYAGASLPLLLIGVVNLQLPLWAFLNTEAIAEEIVRTVIGSISLIAAVPIATAVAAWYFGAQRGKILHKEEKVV